MERERSLLLEGNTQASFKLSPSYLASDEVRPIILKVISNQKYREIVRKMKPELSVKKTWKHRPCTKK